MHHSCSFSKTSLWFLSFGIVVSCGGRSVSSDPGADDSHGNGIDDTPTGGAGGVAGANHGWGTAGSAIVGASGNQVGGAGGFTGGTGGFTGGSTGGTGGSTGGAGGFTGGTGGSTGGAGGSTVGAGGATTGTPGCGGSAGSGGVGGFSGAAGTGIVDGGVAGCPCTRRPGIGTALTCPAGIDESSFATIGPAGGKVELIGREGGEFGGGVPARLTVPPKAFDKDVAITLVETSVPPPSAFVDWSPIYQLSPLGTTSASRMTLQLPWSNGPGIAPVGLTIYFARDASGPFAPLPEVYPNAGFTSAAITEFGFFFVGAPKTASQIACP